MEINSIKNGIVFDHIKAGKSLEIYNYLHLENCDCQVAIIQHANSDKMGKKDILKVATNDIDIDFNVLGFIDSGITVNIIKDGIRVEKLNLKLPELVEGVIECKNPRCITSIEQELPHRFKLVDKEKQIYRCIYCEMMGEPQEK